MSIPPGESRPLRRSPASAAAIHFRFLRRQVDGEIDHFGRQVAARASGLPLPLRKGCTAVGRHTKSCMVGKRRSLAAQPGRHPFHRRCVTRLARSGRELSPRGARRRSAASGRTAPGHSWRRRPARSHGERLLTASFGRMPPSPPRASA
jgi:hypothetical protein